MLGKGHGTESPPQPSEVTNPANALILELKFLRKQIFVV